ncbi:hypothetical protein E7T06_07740 [Deinococcus sp. Arct2-2]|uniref:hypothetical protein n=1 Tax=Deinococcus sp. Arct2-2 TaxID=2568653 RepID=UPI0010A3FAEE|nr:hypothetical protein [Deinococcus sp. Arct2-2]THF70355.1 hypothetical protein E7T06_07740 [Deinococcus sp. Arct2-2]
MTVPTHSSDLLVTLPAPAQATSADDDTAAPSPRYVLHQRTRELVDTVIPRLILTFASAADSALMASIVAHANDHETQQQHLEALREELIAHYADQVAALTLQELLEAHALLPFGSGAPTSPL